VWDRPIFKWLSRDLATSLYHFGKPSPTPTTKVIRLIKRILMGEREPYYYSIGEGRIKKDLSYVMRSFLIAYERHILMRKAWRKVSKGEIVILDRYKSERLGVMDSKRLNPKDFKGIKKAIALLENKIYDDVARPDIIIQLTVPLDVALERNRNRRKKDKGGDDIIRLRYELNRDPKYSARKVLSMDATLDCASLVNKMKEIIWSSI